MTVFSLHTSSIKKRKFYLLTTHHNVIYSNISNASIANKESVHSEPQNVSVKKITMTMDALTICDWAV